MDKTQIKECPILFSTEMVEAILDGRKTQTRRVILPQPLNNRTVELERRSGGLVAIPYYRGVRMIWNEGIHIKCRFGVPGDKLWVREKWKPFHLESSIFYSNGSATRHPDREDWFESDYHKNKYRKGWRPSIHMYTWMSRILLEIADVRVERLQDITPEDARAEGDRERSGMEEFYKRGAMCHVDWFRHLWDSINSKYGFGWDANPWVWVIQFKILETKQ